MRIWIALSALALAGCVTEPSEPTPQQIAQQQLTAACQSGDLQACQAIQANELQRQQNAAIAGAVFLPPMRF